MARLLFDNIENKDVVSRSSMIRSYDRSGLLHEALDFLRDTHLMRVKPSEIRMISITHVLAELADLKLGKAMLAYVMRNGKCGKSGVPLCTALIDKYVKCENLAYARRVFDGLSKASIICLTAMIVAYIHCNNLNEDSVKGDKVFAKSDGHSNNHKSNGKNHNSTNMPSDLTSARDHGLDNKKQEVVVAVGNGSDDFYDGLGCCHVQDNSYCKQRIFT
ncbi:Pentatricopeptide repeat-containing protein, chloroplastic [Glycine soja]